MSEKIFWTVGQRMDSEHQVEKHRDELGYGILQ